MEFARLPPEVNSGRMYAGAGAASMEAAAAAWDHLGAQLYERAATYRSAIDNLPDGADDAAKTALSEAAAPHIEWLNATAARAERAATHAVEAANAQRTALAAMVPPRDIYANRVRRGSLAAANSLGQAGPAIAHADAEYERMWAQDVSALYAYAAASARTAEVTPFTSPPAAGEPASGKWRVIAAPQVLSAGGQLVSTIPQALRALSSSPLASLDACLSSVTPSLSKLSSLSAPSDSAIKHLNCLNKRAALASLLDKPRRVLRASIAAMGGRARSVGIMSVPQAWVVATTPSSGAAEPEPTAWVYEPVRLVRRPRLPALDNSATKEGSRRPS